MQFIHTYITTFSQDYWPSFSHVYAIQLTQYSFDSWWITILLLFWSLKLASFVSLLLSVRPCCQTSTESVRLIVICSVNTVMTAVLYFKFYSILRIYCAINNWYFICNIKMHIWTPYKGSSFNNFTLQHSLMIFSSKTLKKECNLHLKYLFYIGCKSLKRYFYMFII